MGHGRRCNLREPTSETKFSGRLLQLAGNCCRHPLFFAAAHGLFLFFNSHRFSFTGLLHLCRHPGKQSFVRLPLDFRFRCARMFHFERRPM
jgi:hypothetical protein